MSSELKVGDRVKFKAGRGFSQGEIVKIERNTATVKTTAGKEVKRLMSALEKIEKE